MRKKLSRMLELWFGYPFHTPQKEEHAMFLANTVALRSSDLSRQVGAVIVNEDGDLLAMGCNEVPKARGGCPWPEDPLNDFRDFQLGVDPSVQMKERIISEVLENLRNSGWFSDDKKDKDIKSLLNEAIYAINSPLEKARISSILEFGRIVHAEMNSISDAAKRGSGISGMSLYCTTFPCHMCARHIIASGIKEVVFIEPYPKSRAKKLYKNIIDIDHQEETESIVNFRPFEGVAPRRYISFFSMEGKKRKDDRGKIYNWDKTKSYPQVDNLTASYLPVETVILEFIERNEFQFGLRSAKLP
jgi:cytidine deaminase